MKVDQILIRLDAGSRFGLGHLSRCITLVNEFNCLRNSFLIRTDNSKLVQNYIEKYLKTPYNLNIFEPNICLEKELSILTDSSSMDTLLILDHYQADDHYQEVLFKRGVRWLQLDSHAKVGFYANWVMHGSPGATDDLYEPLRRRNATKFLLGPKYCIVKEDLRIYFKERYVRKKLSSVIICFGGGDDRGATLACLEALNFHSFRNIQFTVAVSRFNSDFDKILNYEQKGHIKVVPPEGLASAMLEADLGLIAPGMLSYEAAFLGLPMLLVTIADNQTINSQAWERYGCALNLGQTSDISINLNQYLKSLQSNYDRLTSMSKNCLELVDGNGVKRIIKEIKYEESTYTGD